MLNFLIHFALALEYIKIDLYRWQVCHKVLTHIPVLFFVLLFSLCFLILILFLCFPRTNEFHLKKQKKIKKKKRKGKKNEYSFVFRLMWIYGQFMCAWRCACAYVCTCVCLFIRCLSFLVSINSFPKVPINLTTWILATTNNSSRLFYTQRCL